MVGSALVRSLQRAGDTELLLRDRHQLDLCDQAAVRDFLQREKPDQIYLAAAKVGGIMANDTHPAEFIYQNLAIETNVVHSAYISKVKKLVFIDTDNTIERLEPGDQTRPAGKKVRTHRQVFMHEETREGLADPPAGGNKRFPDQE